MQFAQNAGILPIHAGAIRYPEFDEILNITRYHFDNLFDYAHYLEERSNY
jgi:hypothetical protein